MTEVSCLSEVHQDQSETSLCDLARTSLLPSAPCRFMLSQRHGIVDGLPTNKVKRLATTPDDAIDARIKVMFDARDGQSDAKLKAALGARVTLPL